MFIRGQACLAAYEHFQHLPIELHNIIWNVNGGITNYISVQGHAVMARFVINETSVFIVRHVQHPNPHQLNVLVKEDE
jgi:hypothetical protein